MTIVAFLQNTWVRDPVRTRQTFDRHPDARHKIVAMLMFMYYPKCCLTGRRLRRAFGEQLCNQIVWEEASPHVGGKSDSVFPADRAHMRAVIEKHKPQIVLGFGGVASPPLRQMKDEGAAWSLFAGPHPAARGASVTGDLAAMANWLEQEMKRLAKTQASA